MKNTLEWLIIVAFLIAPNEVHAQLNVLHSFTGATQVDGPLVVEREVIYGANSQAGTGAPGFIFSLNTDGSGYSDFYDFVKGAEEWPKGLISFKGILYGITPGIGVKSGLLFGVTPDGGFNVVHQFDKSSGSAPASTPVQYNGMLYGTTSNGGANNFGVVYCVKPDGSGYKVLNNFAAGIRSHPIGQLALVGSTIYGICDGQQVIFKINTDGTGFKIIHSGGAIETSWGIVSDGASLFWTMRDKNTGGCAICNCGLDGSNFKTVYTFNSINPATLCLIGDSIYGIYWNLKSNVYQVKKDGTNFSILGSFSGGTNGPLIAVGNTLYGSTATTVFSYKMK